MIKKRILPIIKQTAETLGYPEDVVEHLVMYSFARLKEEIASNLTHPKIRLFHFGSFEVSQPALISEIKHLIKKIRLSRHPDDVARLRKLLKLRHKAYDYSKSRKFKQRFGSWHYKAAGGPDVDPLEES